MSREYGAKSRCADIRHRCNRQASPWMDEVERCREQAPASPWMDEVERCREQAPRWHKYCKRRSSF